MKSHCGNNVNLERFFHLYLAKTPNYVSRKECTGLFKDFIKITSQNGWETFFQQNSCPNKNNQETI